MILTDIDRKVLPAALRANGGFHHATEWYLRGWTPIPYQYAWHNAAQMNTTFLAGIASGKTNVEAASIAIDCISIPYFRALSTSVTAKQAELPFDMFMAWYDGNDHLEHLILDIKLRPWPLIKFQNFSEWEFRTCGMDARFIRGSEYDRIAYDECGLDFVGESVKTLRGRLRGTRPDNTKRMARLDTLTSPTAAPWLETRFWRGVKGHDTADLVKYLSFKVKTRDNVMLTEDQIALMEAEYTDLDIDVEMNAEFPDYGMSMFPKRHISACTDQGLNDIVMLALNPRLLDDGGGHPKKGYVMEEHPRHGLMKFEMPREPKGVYIMAGDPGIDDPPKRNAGAIGVLDISKKPAKMVYFDWVSGRGSYMPFLDSFRYAMSKYTPSIKLLDTTGPQKAMQELAFENLGIETDAMNFTRDKDAALNSLSLAVSNHEISWPLAKGIQRQMSTYTRENDRKSGFPQDITMMLAMLAFGMRYSPQEVEDDKPPRPRRYSRKRRTRHTRRVKRA